MYVCTCLCVHVLVCTRACVYTCVCVHVRVCTRACVYIICLCVHILAHACSLNPSPSLRRSLFCLYIKLYGAIACGLFVVYLYDSFPHAAALAMYSFWIPQVRLLS